MKKLEMVRGGIELLIATGVSILVGSAVGLVKPGNLGVIKKIAVGAGGLAISSMAVDKVTDYVDEKWNETTAQVTECFKKKQPVEETCVEGGA